MWHSTEVPGKSLFAFAGVERPSAVAFTETPQRRRREIIEPTLKGERQRSREGWVTEKKDEPRRGGTSICLNKDY